MQQQQQLLIKKQSFVEINFTLICLDLDIS
jgi:hypothetical protein